MSKERFPPLRTSLCLALLLALSGWCNRAGAASACVWRVTNAPAPFYLVGTLHALSGKDYPLPKPYNEALRDSQQLFFEIDPDPKSDFGEKFERAAVYPKGDDIRHHIHAKTWEFLAKKFRISNYLGKSFYLGHLRVDAIQDLRPWAIASYIWGIRGYSDIHNGHGVDNYIAYNARRAGKACGGLETVDEHVEVLRGMTDINSELILLDALVRGDKRRDDFNAMRAGWKRGDVGPIIAEGQRQRELNLEAELRLLDYRNLRWVPRIEGAIKSGTPTSIVAGAGHFCGPNSVIELLQRKGYKIEQL